MSKKVYKIRYIWSSLNMHIADFEQLLKNINSEQFYLKNIQKNKWSLFEQNTEFQIPFRKKESSSRDETWCIEMLSLWVTFGFVEILNNNGKNIEKKNDLLKCTYKVKVKNNLREYVVKNFLEKKEIIINNFLSQETKTNTNLWNYKNEYYMIYSLFVISLFENNEIIESEIIFSDKASFKRWQNSKIPFNNEWYELAKKIVNHELFNDIEIRNSKSVSRQKNNKINVESNSLNLASNFVQATSISSFSNDNSLINQPEFVESYSFISEKEKIKENVSSSSSSILNFVERYITENQDLSLQIPIYQRNYVWEKTIFQKFYNDIFSLASNLAQKYHYIGEISLSSKNQMDSKDSYNIVDGQQRVTSILILLNAIYQYSNDKNIQADSTTKKLFNKSFKNINKDDVLANEKFKHIEGNINFQVLKKILKGQSKGIINDKQIKTNVYKNFSNISKYLKKRNYDQEQIKQILETFYKKVIFTEIIHYTDEQYQLFENLNSNKVMLKNIDLVKNFIIMKMENIEIDKNEEKILKLFESKIIEPFKKPAKIDLFLTVYSKLYLIENYETLDIEKLKIVENVNGINEAQNILPTFKWIINKEITKIIGNDKEKMNFDDYEKLISKINERINLFIMISEKEQYYNVNNEIFKLHDILLIFDDRTIYIPILMFLISKFSTYNEKLKILDNKINLLRGLLFALEKFEVVFKIVEYKNESFSKLIDNIFVEINSEYLNKKDELNHYDILGILGNIKSRHSWNESNIQLFKNEIISDKKLTKQMIQNLCMRIEYFLDNNSSLKWGKGTRKSYWTDNIKKPTIEHIMPQTLNDSWLNYLIENSIFKDLEEIKVEHQKSLNKLGNLIIINGDENSDFGNKLFENKKYSESNVAKLYQFKGIDDPKMKLTPLDQYAKWEFREIKKRTEQLANILVYIYKEIKW